MRLGLSQLNLNRAGRRPIDPSRMQAIRGPELTRRLTWALRESDQLSYTYKYKLTPGVIKIRLACSSARPKPNLP